MRGYPRTSKQKSGGKFAHKKRNRNDNGGGGGGGPGSDNGRHRPHGRYSVPSGSMGMSGSMRGGVDFMDENDADIGANIQFQQFANDPMSSSLNSSFRTSNNSKNCKKFILKLK